MTDRRFALASISLMVSWGFLAIFFMGQSLNLSSDLLPAVISLTYGTIVAICLASQNYRQLSQREFLTVSATPILLLANLAALLMLFSLNNRAFN